MTDEDTVRVVAEVPESVKETAKDKLEYGGISREIRETLERIAFGEDLTQRSRLERQREAVADDLRELREQRREIDAKIESAEERITAIDQKLSTITSREDKFEAKLEELEAQLYDGVRLWDDHGAVRRAAQTGGVEPEQVIRTLKERNPDIPEYAYQQALHDNETWGGLSDHDGTNANERES